MRSDPNDLSEEEKQVLALVEGIIKAYTAIFAIIYARIQSPKLLLSFVVLLSQLQLFRCYFLWLSEQSQQEELLEVKNYIDAEERKMMSQPNDRMIRDLKRRHLRQANRASRRPEKRRRIYNQAREEMYVEFDYWGEEPFFDDLQFQRMFSCSLHVAKKCVEVCIKNRPDVFFEQLSGKKRIKAHVKVLAVLKTLGGAGWSNYSIILNSMYHK